MKTMCMLRDWQKQIFRYLSINIVFSSVKQFHDMSSYENFYIIYVETLMTEFMRYGSKWLVDIMSHLNLLKLAVKRIANA